MKQRLHTGWARERSAGFQLHIKVTKDGDGYVATHGEYKAEGADEAEATRKLKVQLERDIYAGSNQYSDF